MYKLILGGERPRLVYGPSPALAAGEVIVGRYVDWALAQKMYRLVGNLATLLREDGEIHLGSLCIVQRDGRTFLLTEESDHVRLDVPYDGSPAQGLHCFELHDADGVMQYHAAFSSAITFAMKAKVDFDREVWAQARLAELLGLSQQHFRNFREIDFSAYGY